MFVKKCGNCKKWMNHYECKKEKRSNQTGRWTGPSMGRPAYNCPDYEAKDYLKQEEPINA